MSYEFPEAARSTLKISSIKGYTPLIYWLAFDTQATRYDSKYSESIAGELGITISEYTRSHAQTIIDIEQRIANHLELIKSAIAHPSFDDYNRVFDRFGFGVTCRVLLLIHVFPIDRFLLDGKPWIEYERSREKLQKRDRSLRSFQAYLGLSFSYEISGSSKKRKFHGSCLVRSHLYMWAVCMVARQGNIIGSDIGKELNDRYQELRSRYRGKDSLNRILFKVTRMLFYELVTQIKRKTD